MNSKLGFSSEAPESDGLFKFRLRVPLPQGESAELMEISAERSPKVERVREQSALLKVLGGPFRT